MDYTKLSRLMSHMLRHEPSKYSLKLDPDGWADLDDVLKAVAGQAGFEGAALADLERAMAASDKKRHEIADGRIRAVYGHSLPDKIEMTPAEPPEALYHGTARRFVDSILKTGLSPKERQYVHLALDLKTAGLVGQRRDDSPVVLTVDAGRAWRDGRRFYKVDETIWLADSVPPEYIRIEGRE